MKSCNCISNLESQAPKEMAEFFKAKYKSNIAGKPELKNISIRFGRNSASVVTNSTLLVKLAGRKKPVEQVVINSYCPFCGKKYPEIKNIL